MTVRIATFSIMPPRHNGYNLDTQRKDNERNADQYRSFQQNKTQHNESQHNNIILSISTLKAVGNDYE
jgi:hypothetical protein